MLETNILCPVPRLNAKLERVERSLEGPAFMGQVSPADLLHTATDGRPVDTRGNLGMFPDAGLVRELERVTPLFEAAGGTVVVMPDLATARARRYQQQIWITPQDLVIPVCHEGMNRSQVMYMALVGALRRAGVPDADMHVACPHGAFGGFYPGRVPPVLNDDNFWQYMHSIVDTTDDIGSAYRTYFGYDKQPRIGEALVRASGLSAAPAGDPSGFTPEEFEELRQQRLRLRQLVGPLLFSLSVLRANAGRDGRVIVFAFMRAGVSYITSLLEAAGAAASARPDTFRGVVVVAIPFIDDIGMGGISRDRALAVYGDNSKELMDALVVDRTEAMYYACASLLRVVLPDVELGGRGRGTHRGTRSAWIDHAMQTHAALKRMNPDAQYKDSLRAASRTYRAPFMG